MQAGLHVREVPPHSQRSILRQAFSPVFQLAVNRYRRLKALLRRMLSNPYVELEEITHRWRYPWRNTVLKGLAVVDREGVQAGHDYFQQCWEREGLVFYRFYVELYRFLQSEVATTQSVSENNTRRKYIIHVPAWGHQAASTLLDYMLPSLLAKGNIPFVAQNAEVELLVHCNQDLAPVIAQHRVISSIREHAEVVIRPFADSLLNMLDYFPTARWCGAKYHLYGGLQALATHRAACQRAIVSYFNADFVLTSNSLRHGFNQIRAGKIAIMATSFRCLLPRIVRELEMFRNDDVLDVPPEAATQIQCRTIHPAARARVVSEKTKHFCLTAQMLFEDRHGIVVRAYHYHPMLVDGKALSAARNTFQTADSHLLSTMLPADTPFEEVIHVVEDPNELNFLELSEAPVERVYRRLTPYMSRTHLCKLLTPHVRWVNSIPLQRFLLSKRVLFPAGSDRERPSADLAIFKSIGCGGA